MTGGGSGKFGIDADVYLALQDGKIKMNDAVSTFMLKDT